MHRRYFVVSFTSLSNPLLQTPQKFIHLLLHPLGTRLQFARPGISFQFMLAVLFMSTRLLFCRPVCLLMNRVVSCLVWVRIVVAASRLLLTSFSIIVISISTDSHIVGHAMWFVMMRARCMIALRLRRRRRVLRDSLRKIIWILWLQMLQRRTGLTEVGPKNFRRWSRQLGSLSRGWTWEAGLRRRDMRRRHWLSIRV